jgi:DNA-binding transcriptional ArsR family regulator
MPIPDRGEPEGLGAIFAALADPTRRWMVARLTLGPCSVSDLSAPFPISAPAISKHLNVLEATGLIVRWKRGRSYYCQLQNDPLQLAGDWIERQRSFWEHQFANLEDFLRREDGTWTSAPEPAPPSASSTGSKPRPTGSSTPGRDQTR